MKMRSGYKAMAWALALSACEASDDAAVPASTGPATPIYAALVPKGNDATLYLLPQQSRTLTVRYEATAAVPIVGRSVQFALVDSAKGASIDPQSRITDAAGLASVVLTAGAGGEFTLRVSAEGASPLDYTVVVRDAVDPSLRVRVSYAGERTLAERTVTVVPAMDCATVLRESAVGDTTRRLTDDEPARFPVGSAMRYAVAAWGRDDTGGRLARGCVEQTTDISAEEVIEDVEVVLADEPLTITGNFPVVLDAPLEGLGAALTAPTESALAEVAGVRAVADERALYVDAVRRAFITAGGEPSAFASAGSLLAQSLDQPGSPRLAPALGALVDARKARLSASATLDFTGAVPSITLDALQVGDGTGMWSVVLPTAGAAFDAAFVPARAEIDVASLTLPVGLDALVSALALGADKASDLTAALAPQLPCAGFPAVLASDATFTATCDAACVIAACSGLASELSAALGTALAEAGPALTLSGQLAAHARDTTAIADLGPSTLTAAYAEPLSSEATLRSATTQNAALMVKGP
jgi:hypothetical protein